MLRVLFILALVFCLHDATTAHAVEAERYVLKQTAKTFVVPGTNEAHGFINETPGKGCTLTHVQYVVTRDGTLERVDETRVPLGHGERWYYTVQGSDGVLRTLGTIECGPRNVLMFVTALPRYSPPQHGGI